MHMIVKQACQPPKSTSQVLKGCRTAVVTLVHQMGRAPQACQLPTFFSEVLEVCKVTHVHKPGWAPHPLRPRQHLHRLPGKFQHIPQVAQLQQERNGDRLQELAGH